jgi:hypothetical protein
MALIAPRPFVFKDNMIMDATGKAYTPEELIVALNEEPSSGTRSDDGERAATMPLRELVAWYGQARGVNEFEKASVLWEVIERRLAAVSERGARWQVVDAETAQRLRKEGVPLLDGRNTVMRTIFNSEGYGVGHEIFTFPAERNER